MPSIGSSKSILFVAEHLMIGILLPGHVTSSLVCVFYHDHDYSLQEIVIENASLRESLYNMHKHLMTMLNDQQVHLAVQCYTPVLIISLVIRKLKK